MKLNSRLMSHTAHQQRQRTRTNVYPQISISKHLEKKTCCWKLLALGSATNVDTASAEGSEYKAELSHNHDI